LDFVFYASKVLAKLILPPTGLVLLAILALLLLRRWPRTALLALWTSSIGLLVLSLPVVAHHLVGLVASPPFERDRVSQTQAIVVLGGGLRRETKEYGDTVSNETLERVRYGATLAKSYGLPLLVTGGKVYGGPAEGIVMADVLQREFGVSTRWIEDQARHTGENLRFSEAMLAKDGVTRVLLVTHNYHMRRSLAHCERTQLTCLPAPIGTSSGIVDSWIQWLPNVSSLSASAAAIHELCGLLALGIR
jgi:uncharacterized SAM-binding protein YcdF (DUF218 family)